MGVTCKQSFYLLALLFLASGTTGICTFLSVPRGLRKFLMEWQFEGLDYLLGACIAVVFIGIQLYFWVVCY